jgi:hypothetical protein
MPAAGSRAGIVSMKTEGGIDDDVTDELKAQRYKHMVVERNRRNKTRVFTAELQSIVPGMCAFDKNVSINFILEGVLDYVRTSLKAGQLGQENNLKQKQKQNLKL